MSKQTLAAVYDRVSDPKQVEGVMLDARNEKLTKYCEAMGLKILAYETDEGKSARAGRKRPGFDRAMELACHPGRVLVVDNLTRFARSISDARNALDRLHDSGGDLVIVSMGIDTRTAAGKMLFGLLSVLAEFESDQHSERIKGACDFIMKTKGYRTWGAPPYGFRLINGERVRCEEEWEIKKIVDQWAREYQYAYQRWVKTAKKLNQIGVPTIQTMRNRRKNPPEPEVPWTPGLVEWVANHMGKKRVVKKKQRSGRK